MREREREGFEGSDLPQIARSLSGIKHWAIVCMLQRHARTKERVLRRNAERHTLAQIVENNPGRGRGRRNASYLCYAGLFSVARR